MDDELVPVREEIAAISGYLPQFDELAWFDYLNLINKKPEWKRVATPKPKT